MTIDWLTVVAQIFNFLILVYLLKRFLYQPVIKAMDDREEFINSQLTQAQQREQQAQAQQEKYRSELRALREQRDALLSKSMRKAELKAADYLQQAREKIAENRRQWQRELKQEQQDFLLRLRKEGSQAIIHVARQLLQGLADRSLERQMIDVFMQQLEHLDDAQRQALATEETTVQLVSTFAIDGELRDYLTRELKPYIGRRELRFERSEDLICGIEIRAEGQKISWTVADYTQKLERKLQQALDA